MRVELVFTREAVAELDLEGAAAAVVDCLRATTTIAAALAAGARSVLPVATEAAARDLAARGGLLLAGERRCLPPDGFDLGNSPASFTPARVAGRQIVLWTTNGSRALAAAAERAASVVAFALVNAAAVARHLGRQRPARLVVVCAGTEGHFALDDTYAAGALLARLRSWTPLDCDDRATAALLTYRAAADRPLPVLAGTGAAARLRAHGLFDDVRFAARPDALASVPDWRDGRLVDAATASAPGAASAG